MPALKEIELHVVHKYWKKCSVIGKPIIDHELVVMVVFLQNEGDSKISTNNYSNTWKFCVWYGSYGINLNSTNNITPVV